MGKDSEKVVIIQDRVLGIHVCVPSEWDTEKVNEEVNKAYPSGISSAFRVAPEKGKVQCDDYPDRSHYIMFC